MQVSTVLEIKNLSAEGYYSVAGCRGLQLRVTKYGKEFIIATLGKENAYC